MLMPESVAVVYSPIVALPGYKAFRVKDAVVDDVSKCSKEGFHKHETPDG